MNEQRGTQNAELRKPAFAAPPPQRSILHSAFCLLPSGFRTVSIRTIVLIVLTLLSCQQKDPVAITIHEIVDAAEDRETSAVMEHLAPNYSDAQGSRADVEAALRRYFFAYKSIDITVQQLQTTQNGSSGRATFRVMFIGVPKSVGGMDQFLPRSASYLFDVWLVREDGDWKVVTAHWRDASAI